LRAIGRAGVTARTGQPADHGRDDGNLSRLAGENRAGSRACAARARVAVADSQASNRLARDSGGASRSARIVSRPDSDKVRRVIVIGGGLAGMACAVALESVGIRVTLLEARKSLGGRAGSFEDPQTGEQLDNCQHVLLGCCTNLIDFYHRISDSV